MNGVSPEQVRHELMAAMADALQESGMVRFPTSRELWRDLLSGELGASVEPFHGDRLRPWLLQVVKQCAEVDGGLACMVRSLEYLEPRTATVAMLWPLVDEWEAVDFFQGVDLAPVRHILLSLTSDLLPMARRATLSRVQELAPWCRTTWHVFVRLAGENFPPGQLPPSLAFLELVAERLAEEGRVEDGMAVLRWQRSALATFSSQGQAVQSLDSRQGHRVAVTSAARPDPPQPTEEEPEPASPAACWTAGGAVLVGVGAYEHLPDVPAIRNNLTDLQRLLVSGEFGIPVENCRVLADPRDPKRIHTTIQEVVEAVDPASGAFLFYYAGHGRVHPSHGRLLLSMADSQEHQTYSYWSFDSLRDQIAECGLATRLVILDSCYSGSALDLLSGPADSSAAIRGTYVMTSSGATEPSTAPGGARYTDFTGQILTTLRSGIPGAGSVLDADALFETVRAHCLAYGLPVPARQIRNEGSRIPLMRNRAHRTTASH